jgi:hypothetical protein
VGLEREGATTSGNIQSGQQLPGGLVAPHQSMGINFNESKQTNQQNAIMPYRRGPDSAYMAHLNTIGNRRMVEEVGFYMGIPFCNF